MCLWPLCGLAASVQLLHDPNLSMQEPSCKRVLLEGYGAVLRPAEPHFELCSPVGS